MTVLHWILWALLVVTSLGEVAFILLHKGAGGGLSDVFGGGISSSAGSSGVAERNLNRITIGFGVVWFAVVVGLGLMQRFGLG